MNQKTTPAGGRGQGHYPSKFQGHFARNRQQFQVTTDPVTAFREAMAGAGLIPPADIITDGNLHRCDVAGRGVSGKGDGAYLLHNDGLLSGGFQNWQAGGGWQNWCAKRRDTLTTIEREELRRRMDADRHARMLETDRRHRVAQAKAVRIWQKAALVHGWHPYQLRKGILTLGLRVACWTKKVCDDSGNWQDLRIENTLLIPMRDFDGEIWAVQGIFPEKTQELGNRDKDFLTGARKSGLFFLFGKIDPSGSVIICEGFATGATLHENTGETALVAFDAGNMEPVAVECRRRYPNIDLTIACDNDRHTPGNPGLTKGRQAALASGGRLLIPPFADDELGSDWNDWHQLRKGAAND
ncbi:MAG: toprim domain-containing protein [Magnetococcales bacterium]|nr:toprim domain-containing protein [Magnetococcales bacterium]